MDTKAGTEFRHYIQMSGMPPKNFVELCSKGLDWGGRMFNGKIYDYNLSPPNGRIMTSVKAKYS